MRRRGRRGWWRPALIAALVGAGPAGAAGAPPAVALLPLSNSSGEPSAPADLAPAVAARLQAIGFRVVNGAGMEAALARRRIRYTDSLSHADARALTADLGADLLLAGRVLSFRRAPEPQVGFTLRLVEPASGEVVWSRMTCRMGGQYRGALGLGEITRVADLVELVVEEAFRTLTLDATGMHAEPDGEVQRMPLGPNPVAFLRAGAELDRVRTLGILPLQNQSEHPTADQIVRDILTARLWATGRFRVIEPGEMRAQILRRGLFPDQIAGADMLGQLRDELGLDALVSGTVLSYKQPPPGSGAVEPEVELGLRMVSTAGGTILWDALHQRRGEDGASFYEMGRVLAADRLAEVVIDDLLAALARRKGGQS